MIEGVDILKQTEIMEKVTMYEPTVLEGLVFVFTMIVALALFVLTVVESVQNKKRDGECGPIICFLFVILPAIGFSIWLKTTSYEYEAPTGKYEYEVTIADNVRVVDVCKYYDIVSVENDVYVLRDK